MGFLVWGLACRVSMHQVFACSWHNYSNEQSVPDDIRAQLYLRLGLPGWLSVMINSEATVYTKQVTQAQAG